jgi:hypothetical protein
MVSRLDILGPRPPTTLPTAPLRPSPTTGPTAPATPGKPPLKPRKPLPEPTPDITLPKGLRRPPTANDLVIKRTFDGLTPEAAQKNIATALTSPVAPQNKALVDGTITQRVRDMQTALNNVFTPGTPHHQFLASQQPATLHVIGSMSASSPVVYQVTKDGQPPKYYTRAWGQGGFTEMAKPPIQQVMKAEITLEPRGIKMQYPAWENKALAGPLSTVTEG